VIHRLIKVSLSRRVVCESEDFFSPLHLNTFHNLHNNFMGNASATLIQRNFILRSSKDDFLSFHIHIHVANAGDYYSIRRPTTERIKVVKESCSGASKTTENGTDLNVYLV
jgi:hypothetical protein